MLFEDWLLIILLVEHFHWFDLKKDDFTVKNMVFCYHN